MVVRIKWDNTSEALSTTPLEVGAITISVLQMRKQMFRDWGNLEADPRQSQGWDTGPSEFKAEPQFSLITAQQASHWPGSCLQFCFLCYPGHVNLSNTQLSGPSCQIRLWCQQSADSLCYTTYSAGISTKINWWKYMAITQSWQKQLLTLLLKTNRL